MALFAVLISVSFTLGDLAVPFIDPAPLTAARFWIAAAIMLALTAGALRRVHLRAAWRYFLLGGLMAAYFVMMFEGLALSDPVSLGAVLTLTPLMSAVFAYGLMRQVTDAVTAAALILAGLGALWVIFRGDIHAILGLQMGLGERIFLVGCAMHALYTPLVRITRRDEPVMIYTCLTALGGTVLVTAYAMPGVAATNWLALPPIAWACILYLGVVTTAFTFFLLQYAALRLPAAKVMAYGYLVPTFVIIEEGLLGHGWVGAPVWLGVAATVAALLILLRPDEGRGR